jgi:protein SCO1/2
MNMASWRAGAVLLFTLLLLGPVGAYKGSQLSRGPVDGFQLTDQANEPYSFDFDSEGVVVASFIFTRCPDVCPVITQSLKSVDQMLSEREREDVTFVSITVDPEHDTPERLAAYAELHGVAWPHLTGTVEELEPVWATFGLVVQKAVIEAHIMAYQPGEASLTVVDLNNSSQQNMFALNGGTATTLMAEQANWTLNMSSSEFGRMLVGINGTDSPDDGSWYWELNLWNESASAWQASEVGMDGIDVFEQPHLAWLPSIANRSSLPAPNENRAMSMTVLWPDQTSPEVVDVEEWTAYHLTEAALGTNDINVTIEDSSYGHYLRSIDDVSAPEDSAWWWSLYVWNESQAVWDLSPVGMDDITNPHHVAWAPSSVNVSTLPSPVQSETGEEICNGHGRHMGSGDAMHCMCDSGYTWAEDDRLSCVSETNEEYTVGHSTIVYILNPAREPVVAWAGDDWRPEDLAADIHELLEKESLGGYEPEMTPGFLPSGVVLACFLAIVVSSRQPLTIKGEAKGEKTGPPA